MRSAGPRSSTDVWPVRLAVAEGLANARTGRWVSVIMMLAVAWVAGGAGLANAVEVSDLVRAERTWIDAGAHTVVVEPGSREDTGAVDAATCDRLTEVEGVAGAFAVRSTQSAAEPVAAPGTRATLTQVSPGIYAFFGLDAPAGASVLATPATLAPLGLHDGDSTTINVTAYDGTGITVTGSAQVRVVDSPVLGDDVVGTWLLPDLLTGAASRCYVTADAAHLDAVRTYVSEALAAPDGIPAVVRPRLADSAYGLDFATAYSGRPLAWASAAGAVFLTALGALVRWTRRSRLAVYATFGAHRRARMVIQLTEWVALSSTAVVWGWAIAVILGIGLGSDVRATVLQVTAHAVITWTAATIGVLGVGLLPVGTLLDALKERS